MRRATTARLAALGLALALVAGLAGCSDEEAASPDAAPVALPAPLPELELGGFGAGDPAQLADLRGPLVLNVWASWCGPCVKEMPVLEEFHRKHVGRVGVVGVDYTDTQVQNAAELVAETGVTYPLYTDLAGDLSGLGPFPRLRGLPFTAFVDEQGQVTAWEFVIIDDVAELEGLVAEHLGEELT